MQFGPLKQKLHLCTIKGHRHCLIVAGSSCHESPTLVRRAPTAPRRGFNYPMTFKRHLASTAADRKGRGMRSFRQVCNATWCGYTCSDRHAAIALHCIAVSSSENSPLPASLKSICLPVSSRALSFFFFFAVFQLKSSTLL